jgi:hypothetical protein
MICSSENLEPFIAASSSGGTLLKTGGVLGAQVIADIRRIGLARRGRTDPSPLSLRLLIFAES